MERALLRPGERLDDLETNGFRLIQRPDAFRFGTDSVLLAHFAAPRRNERVVDLDNGCVGERLNHFVHAVPSDFAVVCDIHKRRRNGVENAQRSGV